VFLGRFKTFLFGVSQKNYGNVPVQGELKSDRLEIEQEGTGAVLTVVDHNGIKAPTVNATNAAIGALAVTGSTVMQNLTVNGF